MTPLTDPQLWLKVNSCLTLVNLTLKTLKGPLFKWRTCSVPVLWHYRINVSFSCQRQLKEDKKGWFINQIRYLVLMFCRMTAFESLAGPHCVVILPPPPHPNTVHRGPPWEAVSPALGSTKLSDTAVKQNLCASLSPRCQGRTSGMSPGWQRTISGLISPYADICEFSCVVWEFLVLRSVWIPQRVPKVVFQTQQQRMLLKHMKFLSQSHKLEKVAG